MSWVVRRVFAIPPEMDVAVTAGRGDDSQTQDIYCFLEIVQAGRAGPAGDALDKIRVVPGVVDHRTGEVVPLFWEEDGFGT